MIPIVLSGGSGTRLWPVSRAAMPKQFAELFDESLLAKTLSRLMPLGSPRVLTVAAAKVLTERVLATLGIDLEQVIYEPTGRGTAPAVALACRRLLDQGRADEVVGIFPADHLIEDEAAFLRACRLAERCASDGAIVTLGIRPTTANTGYGYIEIGDRVAAESDEGVTAYFARGFREKPDAETAARFVEAGRFFWNAGMFVFRVATMAERFESLMPELWSGVSELAAVDPGEAAERYAALPDESIDYGIMERLDGHVSIPCELGWSDVGSWDELARLRSSGERIEVGGEGNWIFPHRGKVYALVGASDLLVVDTADALLVSRRGASQRVKEVVDRLQEAGEPRATEHVFEHRPWGGFEVLRDTDRFKSKILWVAPGQRLSYQSHAHRSEHWVIVRGRPEIVLDDVVLRPQPGEAVFVPQGAKHRIRNPGDEVVEIIEVQLGTYFGEDDIVRYEDDYDRV